MRAIPGRSEILNTRRDFIATTIAAAASLASHSAAQSAGSQSAGGEGQLSNNSNTNKRGHEMKDRAEDPRITRARLSGPEQVTRNATVAELNGDGSMTVLVKGSNEWVCVPGDENKIGAPPMCMNPMGCLTQQWDWNCFTKRR